MAAVLMLAACAATRYVEVPRVKEVVARQHDTLTVRDSVYVHDSVMVTLRGDTVTVERFNIVYRDRWRDRLRTDTFIEHDTVTVVREVEKPPNAWQRAQQRLVAALLWMLAAAVAWMLLRRLLKSGK